MLGITSHPAVGMYVLPVARGVQCGMINPTENKRTQNHFSHRVLILINLTSYHRDPGWASRDPRGARRQGGWPKAFGNGWGGGGLRTAAFNVADRRGSHALAAVRATTANAPARHQPPSQTSGPTPTGGHVCRM